MSWLGVNGWDWGEIREWMKVIAPVVAIIVSLFIASSQARRAERSKLRDRQETRRAAAAIATEVFEQMQQAWKAQRLPKDAQKVFFATADALSQFTIKELPDAAVILAIRHLRAALDLWPAEVTEGWRQLQGVTPFDPRHDEMLGRTQHRIHGWVNQIRGDEGPLPPLLTARGSSPPSKKAE